MSVLNFYKEKESDFRSSIIQLITGIAEIKLNNSETRHRWEWEGIQIRLFNISLESMSLSQLQVIGSTFINELKNIIILIIAANNVIDGKLSLGAMLSIQYILGQLNVPIQDFIIFSQSAQDAKLSIERLSEIYKQKNEDIASGDNYPVEKADIKFNNVSLRYGGLIRG